MYDRLTEEKRRTLVASALMEAYRLDFFISNILDMAKLENGDVRPHMSLVDIGLIIQDEILRIGPRKERGTFHLGDGLKKTAVTTDPALAGRVISIMVDNSLKHAGAAPQIWLDAAVDHGKIVLSVRDDGAGLEAGKEEEIFSKYTRFGRADQRNAGTD